MISDLGKREIHQHIPSFKVLCHFLYYCAMTDALHLTTGELEAGLDIISQSPDNDGVVEMIVRRPASNEREVLVIGELDVNEGLIGDNWKFRGASSSPPKLPNPAMQLTVMNSRAIALVAREKGRWSLAGDQIFVDLNLSIENLPPGTQIEIGSAVIEISEPPHTGCKKFVARFGLDAMQFVNSPTGSALRLRGLNARIIRSGTIRVGDKARKISL